MCLVIIMMSHEDAYKDFHRLYEYLHTHVQCNSFYRQIFEDYMVIEMLIQLSGPDTNVSPRR